MIIIYMYWIFKLNHTSVWASQRFSQIDRYIAMRSQQIEDIFRYHETTRPQESLFKGNITSYVRRALRAKTLIQVFWCWPLNARSLLCYCYTRARSYPFVLRYRNFIKRVKVRLKRAYLAKGWLEYDCNKFTYRYWLDYSVLRPSSDRSERDKKAIYNVYKQS